MVTSTSWYGIPCNVSVRGNLTETGIIIASFDKQTSRVLTNRRTTRAGGKVFRNALEPRCFELGLFEVPPISSSSLWWLFAEELCSGIRKFREQSPVCRTFLTFESSLYLEWSKLHDDETGIWATCGKLGVPGIACGVTLNLVVWWLFPWCMDYFYLKLWHGTAWNDLCECTPEHGWCDLCAWIGQDNIECSMGCYLL